MSVIPLYPVGEHPLLADDFRNLKTDEEKTAQNVLAELMLGINVAPAYTGDDKTRLVYAVVEQINFHMKQGLTPQIHKSVSNSQPGNTTAYRNRYVSPIAWKIVSDVTGVETIGFRAPGIGV